MDNNSFRSDSLGDPYRFQTDISIGTGYDDILTNYSLNSAVHYYGWAFRLKYQYLFEGGAPYPIHYYSAKIERKSVTFRNMDAGVSLGISDIVFEGDHYAGLSLGYNIELYLLKPISIFVSPSILIPGVSDDKVFDTNIGLKYHNKSYYIGIQNNRFSISGIPFYTLQLNTGKYF